MIYSIQLEGCLEIAKCRVVFLILQNIRKVGFVDINWDLGFESVTRDIEIFSKFPLV